MADSIDDELARAVLIDISNEDNFYNHGRHEMQEKIDSLDGKSDKPLIPTYREAGLPGKDNNLDAH